MENLFKINKTKNKLTISFNDSEKALYSNLSEEFIKEAIQEKINSSNKKETINQNNIHKIEEIQLLENINTSINTLNTSLLNSTKELLNSLRLPSSNNSLEVIESHSTSKDQFNQLNEQERIQNLTKQQHDFKDMLSFLD